MITGSTLEYSQISQGSKICRIVCSRAIHKTKIEEEAPKY